MKNKITGKITSIGNKITMTAGTVFGVANMVLGWTMCPVRAEPAAGTDGGTFSDYSGASTSSVMDGAKDFLGHAGTYIGGVWAVAGALWLVMCIRNEDNEGRNKALLNVVCGALLLSFSTIIKLFMNSKTTGKP